MKTGRGRTGPFSRALWGCVLSVLLLPQPASSQLQTGLCLQEDRLAAGQSAFEGNFCTANDLTFVLIGLGTQDDGCVSTTDTTDIFLRGILQNTSACTRYDAGMWINRTAFTQRCANSGRVCTASSDCGTGTLNTCVSTARWGPLCAREILREPAYTNSTGFIPICDATNPGGGGVDITCGDGPFINQDGDGCGEVLKFGNCNLPDCGRTIDDRIDPTNAMCSATDGREDQTVIDFVEAVGVDCVDRDGDGFAEIPTCASWGQQESDISCPNRACSGGTRNGLQCASSADCPSGTCQAPSCRRCSVSNDPCPSGTCPAQTCLGYCQASCTSGAQCTSGTCSIPSGSTSGRCTCTSNSQCASGQTCVNGLCEGNFVACTSNAQCPTNQTCGVCSAARNPCTFGGTNTCEANSCGATSQSNDPNTCRIELAVPGTSAKCNCQDGLGSNVPAPSNTLTCSCQEPTFVAPGSTVTCSVTYNNTRPSGCTPDPTVPERARCSATGFVRFDIDDGLSGAASGSFSVNAGSTHTGTVGGTPSTVQWTPASLGRCSGDLTRTCTNVGSACTNPSAGTCTNRLCANTLAVCTTDADCRTGSPLANRCRFGGETCSTNNDCRRRCNGGSFPECSTTSECSGQQQCVQDTCNICTSVGGTAGVIGPGDTSTLTFDYMLSSGAPSGAVNLSTTTLWTNKRCSGSGTQCEMDSQCPMGQTCNLDFSSATTQPLTATCSLFVSPTVVTISSFSAHEENGQVVLAWETSSEIGTLGFHVDRIEPDGALVRVNDQLLPAVQQEPGGTYQLVDRTARPSGELTYQVVEVELFGNQRVYGPYSVNVSKVGSSGSWQQEGSFVSSPHSPSAETLERLEQSSKEKRKQSKRNARKIARTRRVQRTASSMQGLRAKINVTKSGAYFVTAAQIAAALGQNASEIQKQIRNRQLRLTYRGNEVAWHETSGNGLVFYAEEINSVFTRHNVYWLESGSGLAMPAVKGKGPKAAPDNQHFTDTVHYEEDLLPRAFITKDPRDDYWFWGFVLSGIGGFDRTSMNVSVAGVAPGGGLATLALQVWGFWDGSTNTERRAEVKLNGTSLGQVSWQSSTSATASLQFNSSLLNEGTNTVEVVGVAGFFFVDSFDITYPRLYRAVNNVLRARPDGNNAITVSGFSEPALSVYEITNPLVPKRIGATTIEATGGGTYRVSFAAMQGAEYLALAQSALQMPSSTAGRTPSNLKNSANRGAYLVITAPQLVEAAQSLAAYRQGQGLDTYVTDVDEIMDAFNDGIYDPAAIRDFLGYAYNNWEVRPDDVVLAGKGTFDYRDNFGLGGNLVPPFMIGTSNGLVAADGQYADVAGNDGLPDISVGRIPVLTSQELLDYVAKVQAYEAAAPGPWAREVLMAADNADSGGDFPSDSDALATLFPPDFTVGKAHLINPSDANSLRSQIVSEINDGLVFMSYIGHGGLDRMAVDGSLGLLHSTDVASMNNGERMPIVNALTCNIGFFQFPGFVTLGEELVLHPNGGAVALFAPAGMSPNEEAVKLGTHMIQTTFWAGVGNLGDALYYGLRNFAAAGGDVETLKIYNLLGDPKLSLNLINGD